MKSLIVALYNYQGKGLDSWHDHGAGMTYMAAKQSGCDVSFLDMKSLHNDQELTNALKGYDLIAFGMKSSYYHLGMKVISAAKTHKSKVMVGGYHATAAPQELVENQSIDYIFHGESEITFPQFLKNPSQFNREIYGDRPQNLDALPWIDRDIYTNQIENCGGWWHGVGFDKMLSVIASRGCPFQCGFCQPIEDLHFGKKLRRRSVDSIIDELKVLKSKYHPQCIMIHDDTFFVQHSWLEEFAEKYKQISLPFWASARSDGICKNPELLRKLVKVGWSLVSVGFESGSQRILDKISKGITVEQNLESAKIIKSAGAKIYANYILGFPWETKEDIQKTAKMADIINAEMPSWAYFTPYPGCYLGDECIRNGWSLLDRNHYDRCPSGQKSKFVDYNYLRQVLAEHKREDIPPLTTDIIIPTYENEEYTVACLESIKQYTNPAMYRIILVDNGSKNFSNVERVLKTIDKVLYIRLPRNEGFVTAINKGIEASTAPSVCLLNNDTVVTPRWLGKLAAALFHDPKLGIVGPLTQMGKGTAVDSHHSLTLHSGLIPSGLKGMDILDINRFLEKNYSGKTKPISFVAFLCALIKREVITKVGFLDINYAMGMYDDNDYNLATRKIGYRCELAIDTCIYHKGRTTFSILQQNENLDVNELLKRNLAYLNKKWGLELKNANIK